MIEARGDGKSTVIDRANKHTVTDLEGIPGSHLGGPLATVSIVCHLFFDTTAPPSCLQLFGSACAMVRYGKYTPGAPILTPARKTKEHHLNQSRPFSSFELAVDDADDEQHQNGDDGDGDYPIGSHRAMPRSVLTLRST